MFGRVKENEILNFTSPGVRKIVQSSELWIHWTWHKCSFRLKGIQNQKRFNSVSFYFYKFTKNFTKSRRWAGLDDRNKQNCKEVTVDVNNKVVETILIPAYFRRVLIVAGWFMECFTEQSAICDFWIDSHNYIVWCMHPFPLCITFCHFFFNFILNAAHFPSTFISSILKQIHWCNNFKQLIEIFGLWKTVCASCINVDEWIIWREKKTMNRKKTILSQRNWVYVRVKNIGSIQFSRCNSS